MNAERLNRKRELSMLMGEIKRNIDNIAIIGATKNAGFYRERFDPDILLELTVKERDMLFTSVLSRLENQLAELEKEFAEL